ncbi:MAG: hypothetical protein FWD61_02550 [Phycisphaerales bacterium]|nr:hypothetical protein [Phycisphaerales bacterium]
MSKSKSLLALAAVGVLAFSAVQLQAALFESINSPQPKLFSEATPRTELNNYDPGYDVFIRSQSSGTVGMVNTDLDSSYIHDNTLPVSLTTDLATGSCDTFVNSDSFTSLLPPITISSSSPS